MVRHLTVQEPIGSGAGPGGQGPPRVCPVASDCAAGTPSAIGCYIRDAVPATALNGWYRHDFDNGGSFASSATQFRIGNNSEVTKEFVMPEGGITRVQATMEVTVPHLNFLSPARRSGGSHFFHFQSHCGPASLQTEPFNNFEIHTGWGDPSKSGWRTGVRQWDGAELLYDLHLPVYDINCTPLTLINWTIDEWLKFRLRLELTAIRHWKATMTYLAKDGVTINGEPTAIVEGDLTEPWWPLRSAAFGNWDRDTPGGQPTGQAFEIRNLEILDLGSDAAAVATT